MFADALRERLGGAVVLSDGQVALLETHYNLLLQWNRKLNLTTVLGLEEAVERHYCESLFLASHLPEGRFRIADVGSGPGFPGFPVAVLRPECAVTLVESHQRKAVFLREASRSVRNIRVLASRAEDVNNGFDWVISRAVSYKDLSANLKRLAPRAALLTGGEEPPADLDFQWAPPVALPWGQHRVLRLGHKVGSENV